MKSLKTLGKFIGFLFVIIIAAIVLFFLMSVMDSGVEVPTIASDQAQEKPTGEKKPFTILVYMNGSNLESDGGNATFDLDEMIRSGFSSDDINLLVYTTGTRKWRNNVIPNDKNVIYRVTSTGLREVASESAKSVADKSALANFIKFSLENYPADKTGLIFWNHGGGSVMGYGYDENFENGTLTLRDLKDAMSETQVDKFEFIGFDACLMATVENAYVLKDYTNYLIASEEIEPGAGWDYKWLGMISPEDSGEEIGKAVVDTYTEYYADNIDFTTLSVIDLSKIEEVAKNIGDMASAADKDLMKGEFTKIAAPRSKTKAYGAPGEKSGSVDMIDIVDMSEKMMEQYPEESNALAQSVHDAVIYYRNGHSMQTSHGLSVYFPYENQKNITQMIKTYDRIGFDENYSNFVGEFAKELTGHSYSNIDIGDKLPEVDADGEEFSMYITKEDLRYIDEVYFTVWQKVEEDKYILIGNDSNVYVDEDGKLLNEFKGEWSTLSGHTVCLYEFDSDEVQGYKKYSIPAKLNGQDVELIAMFDKETPNGRILGAIPESNAETNMPSREFYEIKKGDTISLYYYAEQILFTDQDKEYDKEAETWYEGKEFKVNTDDLRLEVSPAEAGVYLYAFRIVDLQRNEHYSDFIEMKYE